MHIFPPWMIYSSGLAGLLYIPEYISQYIDIQKTPTFKPHIIDLSQRDADEIYARIKSQIEQGQHVNELDLIFLPLYHGKEKSTIELLKDSLRLASTMDSKTASNEKIAALMLVLADKMVSKEQILSLWEEFKDMRKLKILEVAEEKGMEKGMEEGIEKGIEKGMEMVIRNMLLTGLTIQFIVEHTGVSEEKVRMIQATPA